MYLVRVVANSYMYVQIKDTRFQRRCGHSATAINLCPGLTEVTLFGGCPEWVCKCKSDSDFPQIANTTVLRFGESNLLVNLDAFMIIITMSRASWWPQ